MMNLDASDVKGQTSRFTEAQDVSYSTYHTQTGAKLLVGCTPIGSVPHTWVPDAHPSGVSDEAMTEQTGILEENLRFGEAVNVDRGFCFDNYAIKYGITTTRPQKKMKKQTQFSMEDGNTHHKSGTSRIVIEQANSTAKQQSGYLQRTPPALQFDNLARISYLMTNFSAPLTTGVHLGSTNNRAGVLWLGQAEPETLDARKEPQLWCTKTQLALHRRLSAVLVDELPEHVSELVLLEASLEKFATAAEVAAQQKWVTWKLANAVWGEGEDEAKRAQLRSLARETLDAVYAARKGAGRLGVY